MEKTMALDGIVIANITNELNKILTGSRITKIAQPEKDELLLTIKQSKEGSDGKTIRSKHMLVISVNPSLPLIYLTEDNKTSPLQAPTFCMVLRKHLNNCRIVGIEQIGLERVLRFRLEHLNEMGDLCTKQLYVELMGKHSNIIFCEEDNTIIDSIKHISLLVSSVREVLPGRTYFIPNTQHKLDPLSLTEEQFMEQVMTKPVTPVGKKDMEQVVKQAQDNAGMYQKRTILFVDEIHRFNKSQQDYLLPFVEDGTIILIGATTENPYFEVNGALLSRSIIFELHSLQTDDIKRLLRRAVEDTERGMGSYKVRLTEDALDFLADMADGDARAALNAIELAVLTTERGAGMYSEACGAI